MADVDADRRRVLLFGWDGGGNVPPLVSLGKHLIRHGCRVAMVGSDTMAARAEAAGVDFMPFAGPTSWTARPGRALEDEMDNFVAHLVGPELGEELLAATNRLGPDVVVLDCMAGGALSVAEHLGLPTVVLVHLRARFHHESRGGLPGAARAAGEALNRQRLSLGLRPVSLGESLWAQLWPGAGQVFIASLPELEGPGRPLPADFSYIGGLFDPDPDPLPPEVVDLIERGGEPLVVTSFSTTYMHQEPQLATALDALDGLRGVITVGSGIAAGRVRGGGQVVVTSWAAHERLLPHADVVVTHAGHGTVVAALGAGIPLVCLPMGRDQHGNAEQVASLGVGVCLDPICDAAELRAGIDRVLANDTYRQSARKLAAAMRTLGGGERLAAHIGSLSSSTNTTTSGGSHGTSE